MIQLNVVLAYMLTKAWYVIIQMGSCPAVYFMECCLLGFTDSM